ncbi:unnamed protein product [Menidia menidia]|uniref:FXYD domain-containing ion transport regulator n=1 Tax=Menidia menidia TaxID=238744 RepID=A0A8S4BPE5_9TELE|nr:unnamed protein product [Menidia menidia]
MSSSKDGITDYDADFVYDYETLRIGGLTFAGVVVFLSFVLLLECGTRAGETAGEHLLNQSSTESRLADR